ncbi:ATP-binding protein [Magnetospirillum molischianum]|uniref:histidine kinase n=1 Tax=Magnetospirillum molischianum DSM 120 TaxID=1150626 RepID=H8FRD3_MAGML|nr:transporter substrate-binding domain-containing protein [Magnetospirillum molischianum]CCG40921.1 Putative two-component sensor histidine kinase, classical system [Magnetospirillum molischianum DSM 120]
MMTIPRIVTALVVGAVLIGLGLIPSLGLFGASPADAANVTPANTSVHTAAIRRLRVLVDDAYPPFTFRDEQGEIQGIVPDLWALWSARTGIPVTVLGMEWGEAQRRFNAGEADVLDMAFWTSARDEIYDFSTPYSTIDVSIVFDASLSGIKDAATLRGFSVGVKDGDACIDFLAMRGIDSVRRYPSYEAIIDAGTQGEIKVACIDRPPAIYYLIKKGLEGRFRASKPLYSGQFHWVVLKGNEDVRDVVNAGFNLISPEERNKIEEHWLGKSLVSNIDDTIIQDILLGGGLVCLVILLQLVWVGLLRRQVSAKTRELTSALNGLTISEARFRTIFDAINDSIIIFDIETGAIRMANRSMREMFGYPSEEIPSLIVPDLSEGNAPYDRDATLTCLRRTAEESHVLEWLARHRDGHVFWVEVDLRRVTIDDTGPQMLAMMRDITERKESADALTRTIDALTRSNTDLERFAYAASHDLREPLNTLVRYAQLLELRYGSRDNEISEFVEFIVNAAKQMMRLVEGLLEFSRVDSVGRGFDEVDSGRALSVALGYLSNAVAESGAIIHTGSMPVVAADEVQLIQLFQNLIGNALKYRDRTRVSVITVSSCRAGDMWEFLVEDNGIGIDAAYLDQIFVIFKRLHTHSAIPGVGIGLALCKRIVERHGGTLWVESEPGVGTTFHFTLSPPPATPI